MCWAAFVAQKSILEHPFATNAALTRSRCKSMLPHLGPEHLLKCTHEVGNLCLCLLAYDTGLLFQIARRHVAGSHWNMAFCAVHFGAGWHTTHLHRIPLGDQSSCAVSMCFCMQRGGAADESHMAPPSTRVIT